MGVKDATEKVLLSHNDVFADILNVLLFEGEQMVNEDELEDAHNISTYQADGLRWQERDVVKRWVRDGVCLAVFGIENQTSVDPSMPLRVISYDAPLYRGQLGETRRRGQGEEADASEAAEGESTSASPKGQKYVPVITLVLNYGEKSRWGSPMNLKNCLEVPDFLDRYVSDYNLNIFDVAFLREDTVRLFGCDFGVVADFFLQRQRGGGYEPAVQTMRHTRDVLQLLAALTGDAGYMELYKPEMVESEVTMCEILDAAINKGVALGRNEGIALGRHEGIALGRHEGIALGRNEGIVLGETNIMKLIQYLIENHREDDIRRMTEDAEYLKQLRKELETAGS